MYWDVHCHLTDQRWRGELSEVLAEARSRGIVGFGMGGYCPEEWLQQVALKKQWPDYKIIPIFGLHPMWVSEVSEEQIELGLHQLAQQIQFAQGVGEIGLDARSEYAFHWGKQMEAFRSQLEIAGLVRRPIVLHVVRCHHEVLQVLWLHRELLSGGFVHAFSGNREIAKQYLDLGLLVSLGGRVTHSNQADFKELIRWLPKEAFLVETDSPDQKIKNWPRSLNYPVALLDIARAIAELRGESVESVLLQSSENFCRTMRL